MRERWKVRNYVDLLAGPGKNRVEGSTEISLGSPLLALTTTYPFTGYFFTDSERKNTDALLQRVSVSPYRDRVKIQQGDCNALVDSIVSEIKTNDASSLNLAFLDPEGLELNWATVAKLSSVRRMDLIINYPEGGLNRYLKQAYQSESHTAVDDLFGERSWREVYRDWQSKTPNVSIHRLLVQHYKRKLQALGYQEVIQGEELENAPLIRNVQRNAPLYRLLFASKHPLGHDFWKKITRRDVYGQGRLF
jgi:three-Cys-motif partner protein